MRTLFNLTYKQPLITHGLNYTPRVNWNHILYNTFFKQSGSKMRFQLEKLWESNHDDPRIAYNKVLFS